MVRTGRNAPARNRLSSRLWVQAGCPKGGGLSIDTEARAVPGQRTQVQPVIEQIRGAFGDKQAEAEAIGSGVVGALEGTENFCQSRGGYPDAAVLDLDAK